MIDISICKELKEACPTIALGCIQAHVIVENSSDALLKEISSYCKVLNEEIHIEELSHLPQIEAGRDLYKKLGKAPSKYRLSSEALIRRVLQGKGLYKVNNVVDINNLISLKSKFPAGSYNIKNIYSPISLSIGKEGEHYKGIGKALINISNLPVLTDSIGSFGSPTSDSERAMITDDVNEILLCIYSFSDRIDIEKYLEYGKHLLEKYAGGKGIEIKTIE
ncbi:B3/4 domain-containing protein [uncultured Clostridium sp.]|jgi:DNA/RNA-binding domain of Phe-tRNA-synthetase-like protein|uniref:B3/B4 domain-containing protein n=1 Tax=uncultured Clostridium sp. TaxID=59620 RepID=UPI0025FE860C|nr:phenylalanine--tRNA ligase beta subunit-related protein [uncultured Clostridium sp.]